MNDSECLKDVRQEADGGAGPCYSPVSMGLPTGPRAWTFALFLSLALNAWAWPVDEVLDIREGGHRFQKLLAPSWVQVENPKVATADIFPDTGEVLLEGKSTGRTLMVAYAQGRVTVWQVRVGLPDSTAEGPPRPPRFRNARQACPTLNELADGDVRIRVRVADDACRKALLALFESDGPTAQQLELTFEMPVLQLQLDEIEKAFIAAKLSGLSVKYLGAGLVLSGKASEPEHRQALLEIFRHSVGRVALEDNVESP